MDNVVQSLNTKVDLTTKGTSYMGMADYGQIMIGDKAFEFYNDRNKKDYVQIPWEEVDYVIASVMFGGRWIPRFAFRTKKDGTFTFATKQAKVVLKAIHNYVPGDRMRHSLSFFQVIRRGIKSLFTGKKKA